MQRGRWVIISTSHGLNPDFREYISHRGVCLLRWYSGRLSAGIVAYFSTKDLVPVISDFLRWWKWFDWHHHLWVNVFFVLVHHVGDKAIHWGHQLVCGHVLWGDTTGWADSANFQLHLFVWGEHLWLLILFLCVIVWKISFWFKFY